MINLKYELTKIEITKKFNKIKNNDFIELELNGNYLYTINNENIEKKQKSIAKVLSEKIELNLSSIAYKKNLSYYDFLLPHKNNYNFIRLDVKSFFYSLKEKYIRNTFGNYFKNTDNEKDLEFEDETKSIDSFINLIMIDIPKNSKNIKYRDKKILPIGFSTSPIISNIVFRPLDIQIQKLCHENNIKYTRYADDMLFSSSKNNDKYINKDSFIDDIQTILLQFDLRLNKKKTIIKKHTLSLNGYIINNGEIRLSNKKTDIIKKMIHFHEIKMNPKDILKRLFNYELPSQCDFKGSTKTKFYNDQLLNKLTGYRSFLISIIKFDKKHKIFNNKIATYEKYQKLILELEDIINEIA